MASGATAAQVAVVLQALAENFLVDVPAVHDGKGTYLIEFTTLANAMVNSPKAWYQDIANYINMFGE